MNRSKFAVLSALVMLLKEANNRYEVREKRSGIESLIGDLIDGMGLDVEVSSGDSWKDSRSVEGVSSATKSRALNDLVDLGVFEKKYGKYRLAEGFKPEFVIADLGDQDGS